MKALKYYIALLVLPLLFVSAGDPKEKQEGKVKWMSFEEAVAMNEKEPRKIFVDVYTDWCGWCKRMDALTFEHPVISEYLNDKYYAVKLNAEQREDINFNGHTFKFQSNGGSRGVHELAAALLQNKMSYPTTVVLNEEFKILQPLPGFKGPQEFDVILKYFGEDKFKSKTWEEFTGAYNSPVKALPGQ